MIHGLRSYRTIVILYEKKLLMSVQVSSCYRRLNGRYFIGTHCVIVLQMMNRKDALPEPVGPGQYFQNEGAVEGEGNSISI